MTENVGIPMRAFDHTCHRDTCEEPLPWDMAAVAINQTNVYCSPDCARAAFNGITDYDTVTLHDPQHHAGRPDGVRDDAVDIGREVVDREDAKAAISACEDWYPGAFRPTPNTEETES